MIHPLGICQHQHAELVRPHPADGHPVTDGHLPRDCFRGNPTLTIIYLGEDIHIGKRIGNLKGVLCKDKCASVGSAVLYPVITVEIDAFVESVRLGLEALVQRIHMLSPSF